MKYLYREASCSIIGCLLFFIIPALLLEFYFSFLRFTLVYFNLSSCEWALCLPFFFLFLNWLDTKFRREALLSYSHSFLFIYPWKTFSFAHSRFRVPLFQSKRNTVYLLHALALTHLFLIKVTPLYHPFFSSFKPKPVVSPMSQLARLFGKKSFVFLTNCLLWGTKVTLLFSIRSICTIFLLKFAFLR